MSEPIKASDYVELGELLSYLCGPSGRNKDEYLRKADRFRRILKQCGFLDSRNASQPLSSRTIWANPSGIIDRGVERLEKTALAARAMLRLEADNRQMFTIQSGEVSKELRNLPNRLPTGKVLTEAQTRLLDEVVRSIQGGAYRAAAVMCWNLAYDYIRQWVFDNRLADFNKGLAKACPPKTPISQYRDFFDRDAPNESQVIDAMVRQESGPIIGRKLHDHLVQHLDYRNKYAHASEKAASAHKTNAFIENMIDIITAAPFA